MAQNSNSNWKYRRKYEIHEVYKLVLVQHVKKVLNPQHMLICMRWM